MILLLDNQDSFVHNLARYFRRTGVETRVIRSNQVTADQALGLFPQAIVLSPGPHGPADAGCCIDLIRRAPADLPILGVCLGHQAIGAAFGGGIVQSEPRHGMSSPIQHNGDGLFRDCPNPMDVGRYHSLVVSRDDFPGSLRITASSTDDGVIMGLRHRTRPVFGVQFHPESVLCESGDQVIQNFASLATCPS
ncbi:aminodeoxychorismate/anthranilate synthase component II [Stieleria sp. TO1_6]|uniref:anthranilate synthase component II n=1 Tax=Stieleria tagensis TaxID=2956795 RepID=UPI00209B844E|nr:aminodeoxychorismate/anthranilate synthase component II [Stieleria tagensis]MCO8122789.1 aminodeoxychorismate/anthranilate synthase component II [Stieleria tagensis]